LPAPTPRETIVDVRLVLALAGVFALCTLGTRNAILGLALTGVAGLVFWLVSIWMTPFRRCRTCKGTGRQSGTLFTWANRQCPACGGAGRHRRYGVSPIYGDKQTRGEARAATARQRGNRPR
jgi:hypothetical protein